MNPPRSVGLSADRVFKGVQGQISDYIFAPNGGCCLYQSSASLLLQGPTAILSLSVFFQLGTSKYDVIIVKKSAIAI